MVMVPKRWHKCMVADVAEVARGASPRPIENYLTPNARGINWIKIGDAPINGNRIRHTAERITPEGALKSVFVRTGDLILSNSMSFGRPYVAEIDGCIHDGWLKLSSFSRCADREFLVYLLSSRAIISQYESLAAGSGVKNLNKEVVSKVVLLLPQLAEQRAIADVLSGFDEHLANLDELIAKKKAIRDGALEELVTGRTRIADYRDPWVKIRFEEAIQPKARIGWQGLKAEEYLPMGYSYLIGGTDFDSGTIAFDSISFVSSERYELDPYIQVRPGDVLVTKDGTIGKIARVPQLNKPATLNSGVFVFRPNVGLSREFLYWVLMSPVFERFIDTLAAGSTIKHLYQKDLKDFTFMAPPSLSEQTALAEILFGVSEEIRLLEEERAKVERLKLGAMDDLLTGRLRLPIEERTA
ncbi:hypothetical protein HMPREF2820_03065 [Corynebacterium sp. HMSC064E08]|nr:hypothetical protein HMPREF2820_03065 [Corynebacterium sp. HMSC064E08]